MGQRGSVLRVGQGECSEGDRGECSESGTEGECSESGTEGECSESGTGGVF